VHNTTLASKHIKIIVNIFDSSGEQNDAHEFLVFIFDKLNDELLKLSKTVSVTENDLKSNTEQQEKDTEEGEWEEVKKGGKRMKQVNTIKSFETSIIGRLFQGILKHELYSKGQSLSKCNVEPFFVLSLDFGEVSLENCFKKFFSKRKIETSESSDFGYLSQKTYIEKLPSILIIHLKAFYYDKNLKKIVKIMKEIDYSTEMLINSEYISPSMQYEYKKVKYDLISVIIHRGTKASEGHYTCFCKDNKGIWWNLDDTKIFKVDEKVFNTHRPYILFYRKSN
jgi:ubiquitin carboxyl-terminal hydrolase 10